MKLAYSPHFLRSYNKAPAQIRSAFDKQSALLLQNLRHPSLRAKKYDATGDLWQGPRDRIVALLLHHRR
jgi:hypothetical protein